MGQREHQSKWYVVPDNEVDCVERDFIAPLAMPHWPMDWTTCPGEATDFPTFKKPLKKHQGRTCAIIAGCNPLYWVYGGETQIRGAGRPNE